MIDKIFQISQTNQRLRVRQLQMEDTYDVLLTFPTGPSIASLRDYLSFHSVKRLEKDIEQCCSPSVVSSNGVEQRLSALTRQDVVQDWLQGGLQASAILIHGQFPSTDHISPLSYLCAQISRRYSGRDGFLVLSYFCSLHADVNDKKSNPATMLICLIEQLLSCRSIESNYNSASFDEHLLKGLKKKDVGVLCTVFRMLIEQLLPCKMVVFCLIDSISFYEVEEHQHHTRTILESMEKLVRSQSGSQRGRQDRMIFKLMVTDGASSMYAYEHFKSEHMQTVEMNDAGNGSNVLELRCTL